MACHGVRIARPVGDQDAQAVLRAFELLRESLQHSDAGQLLFDDELLDWMGTTAASTATACSSATNGDQGFRQPEDSLFTNGRIGKQLRKLDLFEQASAFDDSHRLRVARCLGHETQRAA